MLNNIVFVTIKDRAGLKASLMNIMLCHLRYDDDDDHDDYDDDDDDYDDGNHDDGPPPTSVPSRAVSQKELAARLGGRT